jgi:septal ring-binding cell division protein DamX
MISPGSRQSDLARNRIATLTWSTATTEQASTRRPGVVFLLMLLLLTAPFRVDGSTVTVPIKLDYPLLRQLLVEQLFNTPNQSAEILHDPSGCSRIVLANPRLGAKRPDLEIVTEVKALLGVSILDGCSTLLQWQGSASFVGRPVIQPGATSLRIEPTDSWLVAADGSKVTAGKIWDLAKDRFQPLFSRFTLDLAPSINVLGMMLPDVLAGRSTQQLQTIVGSLRLSDIQVTPTSLDVSLGFQMEELAAQPQPEAMLSARELQQWETRWQMMDALFTFAVKYYASATSLQELRSTALDILLDSRYRLREALTAPASRSNDPVRRWFLDSWKRLSPVIRRIGLEHTGQEPLLWIRVLTATDALYALDRLGPAIGLDISADGLRRLARLINKEAGVDPLRYDQAVDPELQRLFQLPSPSEPERPLGLRFDLLPIRSAWAGPSTDRLDRWAPSTDKLDEYLPMVASLLQETVEKTLKKQRLEPPVVRLFRRLVLTTAWQESCWRQYVVNKTKIEPLRSDTGDVGLMQMNEKVWRGFYDIQKLRWDTAYNSRAGAEVLLNYLVKYALKQGEQKRPGGLDNLARASYSAYNGGPSQVSRYRKSHVAASHKKVDAAFWKKYQQVKAGNELNVAQCIGGKTADSAPRRPAAKAVKRIASGRKNEAAAGATAAAPRDAGEGWVLAQEEHHFTLQLAVFSQRESARRFIAQQSLAGQVGIYALRKGQSTQFVVLYGSYVKRTDADQAKRRLKHLKPWVRQFGAVRKAGRS